MAASPGHSRLARVLLTTTAGIASGLSRSSKSLPARTGTRRVRKNPGETVFASATKPSGPRGSRPGIATRSVARPMLPTGTRRARPTDSTPGTPSIRRLSSR